MTNPNTMAVVGLIAVLSHTNSAADESPATNRARITVSYSLTSPTFVLHEPVLLAYELNNESRKSIQVDLGQDRKEKFLIVLTPPSGKVNHLPPWRREGISRLGTVTIDPGEAYADKLLLNEWTDFEVIGKYGIEVRIAEPDSSDASAILQEVPPFKATFEILPRDAHVLSGVCEDLVRRIEQAPSVQEAMDAGLRLSYVRDPVAVPFLERALRSGKNVETLAVSGLERIGDRSAARVLISQLAETGSPEADINTRSGTTSALARSALASIQARTTDSETKRIIEQAVARVSGMPAS